MAAVSVRHARKSVAITGRRRWVAGGLAALLAATMAPSAALASTPPAGPAAGADIGATSIATVTLVTGDQVRLVTGADGAQNAYLVDDPSDPRPGALVVRHGGDLSVYPAEALPYLRSGAVDEALFDVTALVAQGLDDASVDQLQLMATSPTSPLTTGDEATGHTSPVPATPPASEATTKAPWLGLVGLRVDKADAREFWAGLEATRVSGDEAGFRRGVGKLWLDRRFEASLDRSVVQIGAPAAYAAGLDGSGVTVAVLDTGIDDQHVDVAGKVIAQQDFTGEGTTDDLFGHGTHVASIIAGSGELSGGKYHGVAPGASLLDGRVLDENGFGDESWILAGMEWAAEQGADIANLSLGGGPTDGTDPLAAAVDALSAQFGTLFVIAAGNDGNGVPAASPGSATSALTVGSVGRTDELSWYSSGAPRLGDAAIKPEISAPGEDIVAAQADGTQLGPVVEPGYVALSGTSMATPHVAGAAALLAQEHPAWTAPQLKADLIATAAPIDAPVYRAGTGRVDVAAAIATDGLAVDAGTLGFGFLAWPHGDAQPVTRTLTYTNTGAGDVTLDLSAALSDALTGDPLPEGTVKISPTVLTVPAGGSAPVDVTVAPGDADPGQWSGDLVAVAADGRTLRTGLGFESEPERYDLTVTVLGTDGAPTYADLFLINLDTGDVLDSWSQADPTAPFRVAPGRWSVMAFAFSGDAFGSAIDVGIEPEATVSGPTELVVDLRKARPLRLAPDDSGVTQSTGSIGVMRTATTPDGGEAGLGVSLTGAGRTDVRITPTGQVRTGGLTVETDTSWRVPEIAATVPGSVALHPALMTYDDRLDGERTVLVRPAATVHRGEVALVKAAEGPLDAQVAAAAARGATAVIAYPADSQSWMWLEAPTAVPVVALPADEGARLARLAAARHGARVHLSGELRSSRTYDLVRDWTGRAPAGADVLVRRRDLALVTETYSTFAGPGQAQQVELPWSPLGGMFASVPVPLGGTRQTYLTPGLAWDTIVDYGSYPDAGTGFTMASVSWQDSMATTTRGERVARSWLRQVARPAVPATGLASARIGDDLAAYVPLWTDGDGHRGDPWVLDDVAWRLTSGGHEVASGTDPYVQASLDPAKSWYRLTLDAALTSDPTWRLSTSTRTTWTFPSGHTDPDAEVRQLPLLALDAHLPLRQDNTAQAWRPMSVGVDVRVPEGVAVSRVRSLVVETSTDGGVTWHKAEVRRTDADSFVATVRNGGPGDVALRISAKRADGTAVVQQVQAAYRVR